MDTTEEKQLRRSAPAHQNQAGSASHNLSHQFGNFAIGKGTRAIRGKRGERAVIIEQQGALCRPAQLFEKPGAQIISIGSLALALAPATAFQLASRGQASHFKSLGALLSP